MTRVLKYCRQCRLYHRFNCWRTKFNSIAWVVAVVSLVHWGWHLVALLLAFFLGGELHGACR